MRFVLLTLFPDFFSGPLSSSILARAAKKKLLDFKIVDLRNYAEGRHRVADDVPYGGGAGMVMKPEPVFKALADLKKNAKKRRRVVLFSPQGRSFDQSAAKRLAKYQELVLLCGHYEGIDERAAVWVDEEISIGDYVLSGGEAAALVLVDAVSRLVPGVLGNAASARQESFEAELLEGPQYTRPADFAGQTVPEVLRGGHHAAIAQWRQRQSLERTLVRRPDLLAQADLTAGQKEIIKGLFTGEE